MISEKIREYDVLGLMSGTSLDGLDLAFCHYICDGEIWKGEILRAETKEYTPEMKDRLRRSMEISGVELAHLDNDLGILLGEHSKDFLHRYELKPICIASHGHTVFHQPDRQMTLQIGNPAALAVKSGFPTVADFRRTDVALGGQGAPLVPFGDVHLFSEYDYCLNLGGIANITSKSKSPVLAFDICPANMALNQLMSEIGKSYDDHGILASTGKVDDGLLERLNSLEYYSKLEPKSLGREWFENVFFPLIQNSSLNLPDRLATCVEHIAFQISTIATNDGGRMLITGGGALNSYLIERIKVHSNAEIIIPDINMIQFKEAFVFGFLGLMRFLEIDNTWSGITGASRSSCGGAIYLP